MDSESQTGSGSFFTKKKVDNDKFQRNFNTKTRYI